MTTPTNNPSMTETAPINLEDLALLFMHTDDAVCAIDAHQRILYWNQAAEDTLGFASAEVIGRPCYAVFQGQKPDKKRFCHPDCPLFQAASAGVACPCHLLLLATKQANRVLFCVSTLAIEEECRHNNAPILIHLWRSFPQPCPLHLSCPRPTAVKPAYVSSKRSASN